MCVLYARVSDRTAIRTVRGQRQHHASLDNQRRHQWRLLLYADQRRFQEVFYFPQSLAVCSPSSSSAGGYCHSYENASCTSVLYQMIGRAVARPMSTGAISHSGIRRAKCNGISQMEDSTVSWTWGHPGPNGLIDPSTLVHGRNSTWWPKKLIRQ